jgi:ferritin-like metal-binding protein YciE
MATKEKTLDDAFLDGLKDIYYAEKQSVRALTKGAKAAQSEELKEALDRHREESAGQVERLEQVFEQIGKPARAKTCEAVQGLTAEMQEHLDDYGSSPAADAVLLASAQALEHYEIARYGTLATWAKQLGYQDAAGLLQETLQEEKRTDELLTQIAGRINSVADQDGESGEDEDTEEPAPKRPSSKSKR